MQTLPYKEVDVFTAVPFLGNPLAVLFDAEGLSSCQMQAIAHWTNLSETAFILPATDPNADYRVRIFTPLAELPFAGHPTLGAAHAVLESQRATPRDGVLTQECGIGLVRLFADPNSARITLEVPNARFEAIAARARTRLEDALQCPVLGEATIVELGPRWLTAEIDGVARLRNLRADFGAVARLSEDLSVTGVNLFARDETATEVRSFAPFLGVAEDPVCGSGNGAVAAVLRERGETRAYVARQGRNVARDGFVFLDFVPGGPIRLGGDVVTCVEGRIAAPVSTHRRELA